MRVQVLPATRNQLVVTHSGEPRYLLAVRAGEWFARVAAPRRSLADQPDLVRLDLFVFHVNNSHGQLCQPIDGNRKPLCGRPFAACFVTRGHLENRAGRKHAFQAPFRFYGNDGPKFPKNCSGRCVGLGRGEARSCRMGDSNLVSGSLSLRRPWGGSRYFLSSFVWSRVDSAISTCSCLSVLVCRVKAKVIAMNWEMISAVGQMLGAAESLFRSFILPLKSAVKTRKAGAPR